MVFFSGVRKTVSSLATLKVRICNKLGSIGTSAECETGRKRKTIWRTLVRVKLLVILFINSSVFLLILTLNLSISIHGLTIEQLINKAIQSRYCSMRDVSFQCYFDIFLTSVAGLINKGVGKQLQFF